MPPYGEGGGGVAGAAPAISVIELYVTPFDPLVGDNIQETVTGELSAGQVIGFSIAVHDNEGDGWQPWPPERMQRSDSYVEFDIMSLCADYFLDGILLPACLGGSAVESDSWGRIKASLELEQQLPEPIQHSTSSGPTRPRCFIAVHPPSEGDTGAGRIPG